MTQTIRLVGDRQRRLAHQLVDRAPPNATVTFKEEARTNEANSLMWVLLSDISRAKPEKRVASPEIWKCLFMASVGHKVRFEPALDGEGVIAIGYRSSRLSKRDMSDMIEAIYAYGTIHGVQWSDKG